MEFLTASVLIILLPGPSVLFTIGRAIAFGKVAAVLTVLGNSLGALVLAAVAAAGVGPLVQQSEVVLLSVQFAGAVYLVYLGIQAWRARGAQTAVSQIAGGAKSAWVTVKEGFAVGVLNPKTAVFFATVMPRFLGGDSGSVSWQLFAMGCVFVAIAFVSDSCYGLLAGQLRTGFESSPRRLRLLGAVGGVIITALGVGLTVGTVIEWLSQ